MVVTFSPPIAFCTTRLRLVDRQPVARELLAVPVEVEEVAAAVALGEDAARARAPARSTASTLRADRVDRRARSAPEIFRPTGVRMPVVSMSMRALIGIVQAFDTPGSVERLVHLGDQLFLRDVVAA